ncbi:rho GTPase-activating protein 22-like [Betta splendens]|uniref:Rho GTPase-activating protein 22-like n=1 Tax=Betta splendens TaxID=158456 RepID=A0A6P7NR31_BETSP|nr:rho GTPase-activating protein 22-like [Betta splendens]
MELHCLPTETPTTASSCSTDPLYDNCPPFAQLGWAREKEMKSGVVCPAVTRLPGPCSPPPGLAPAVAEVPTLVGGGRGPGAWPDHSYCSWRGGLGGQASGAEMGPGVNSAGGGERGGERGGSWGREDRASLNQSPSPSQSEEHRSALSLYDNLPDAVVADLQEVSDMETDLQEPLEEQMYQACGPEHIQGLMEDEGVSEEKSTWSSCEIILGESGLRNHDEISGEEKEQDQEPELDSDVKLMLNLQLLMPSPTHQASYPPSSQTGCQAPWSSVEEPEQSPRAPRVPPPVPLADPSASALRSLLTSLQQQIVRQREEYEEKIIRLEQRNEELQVKVVRLTANLTQQRHWYQAVQAKIVETERTRAAAERQNATLQREMEQFFDTFGELNNEAKKTEIIVKSF